MSQDNQTNAERARSLVEAKKLGTLCTLSANPEGFPFGSLMPYIVDDEGNPIFIASDLAEHTTNFLKDSRASLFIADGDGVSDPLALERVTLIGLVSKIDADTYRQRYLDVHPDSSMYIDMKDFSFYRLGLSHIRYVGGFGRMSWIQLEDFAKTTNARMS